MALILELRDISKSFSGLVALDGVNFGVNSGEIVGIIGPNGAGKSTLFNVISGFFKPTKGRIILEGNDVTGLKPYQLAQKGIVRTFQLTTLFAEFSSLQNILVSLHMRSNLSIRQILFSRSFIPESEIKMANDILEIVGLTRFKNRVASELPHGYQRMLGIGIALANEPKILLLDEPVTGMNADERKLANDLIRTLNSKQITILLVEHNIKTIMNLCKRVIVLNFGRKIAESSPDEVRRNRDVIEAYLGPQDA